MKTFFCGAISILALLAFSAHSQTLPQKTQSFKTLDPSGKESPFVYAITQDSKQGDQRSRLTSYLANRDGSKATMSTAPGRVIVKLRDFAGVMTRGYSLSARVRTVRDQHSRFLADVEGINRGVSTAGAARQLRVLMEFSRAFNGFVLEGDGAALERVRGLSYVDAIVEDRRVQAVDLNSSQLINADDVWNEFGSTGKNINIGIIDTGIDYTHQDLGGGLGPGYKVKGGYDFVNEDNDPMDDHSHGTHVAGIAAGNGPGLQGVAPDANLFAYKVLTADGWGWTSWIVAAIERTVDPDQNPETDDKLDVVNMSLGGPVTSNDPMVEAVNNAVAAGVTFVIAAGNSYDYGTVGSPGVAESAITVGATDDYDYTASFSSKGPVENTFAIKPDVAAPGVDIYSSIPGNQYANYSGTSMASPHVAGAAALLLEAHPEWTPAQIKGALMGSAVNTHSEMIWHQGTGRIDVHAAIQSQIVFTPGSISLGLLDAAETTWTETRSIRLENVTNADQEVTISVEGEQVGSGIDISASPSSFVVAAGSSQEIQVTFTIDVAALSVKSYPEAYTGALVATTASKTVRAPYAFLHTPVTHLSLTGELPEIIFVVGANPGNYYGKTYTPQPEMDIILPDGEFDIIAIYPGSYFVFRENVSNTDEGDLVFDKSNADNLITFDPRDRIGGILIPNYETLGSTVIGGPTKNFATFFFGPVSSIHISDVNGYGIDYKFFDADPLDSETFYDVSLSTGIGITESLALTNDADSFTSLEFVNPSVSEGAAQGLVLYLRMLGGWSMFNGTPKTISNPLRVLASRHEPTTNIIGVFGRMTPTLGMTWESAVWNAYSDQSVVFSDFWGNEITSIPGVTEYSLTFGQTMPRFNPDVFHWDTYIYLSEITQMGYFNRFHGEREIGQISYKLVSPDSTVVASGITPNRGFLDESLVLSVPQNQYQLILEYPDYHFQGGSGLIETVLSFDTRTGDINPPAVRMFNLEANGIQTNNFYAGDEITIRLQLAECGICDPSWFVPDSVSIHFKPSDSSQWVHIGLTNPSTGHFEATLPLDLAPGNYDVQLFARDFNGNSVLFRVQPAFSVLSGALVTLQSPENGATSVPVNPLLQWSCSDESVTTFLVQVSDTSSFVNPLVNTTVAGNSHRVSLGLHKQYHWRVKPENGQWSPVFHFTTENAELSLSTPANGADNVAIPASFTWSVNVQPDFFRLYLAEDSTFTIGSVVYTLEESAKIVGDLAYSSEYFWKVEAVYDGHPVFSAMRSFNTKTRQVQLTYPHNEAQGLPLTVMFTWTNEHEDEYLFELSGEEDFGIVQNNAAIHTNCHSVEGLLPGVTYYWRVKGNNSQALWSEIFQFTTGIPEVLLVSPADGETSVGIPVTFSWNEVAGASTYFLVVSKSDDFTSGTESYSTTDESYTTSLKNDSYHWKVAAVFANDSIWSATWSFSTKKKIVTLVSPENDAADQQLTTSFAWAGDDGPFTLELSSDESFSTASSVTTTETNTTISRLTPGRTYFWRVKPEDDFSEWSETFTFSTLLPEISLLEVTQEVNGTVTATFRWNEVADVDDYSIKVSTLETFSQLSASATSTEPTTVVNGLVQGTTYFWKVGANFSESTVWSDIGTFRADVVLSTEDPEHDALSVHPNPAESEVYIKFKAAGRTTASIRIISPAGVTVKEEDLGFAGDETIFRWIPVDEQQNRLPSGMYFAIIKTDEKVQVAKIILRR